MCITMVSPVHWQTDLDNDIAATGSAWDKTCDANDCVCARCTSRLRTRIGYGAPGSTTATASGGRKPSCMANWLLGNRDIHRSGFRLSFHAKPPAPSADASVTIVPVRILARLGLQLDKPGALPSQKASSARRPPRTQTCLPGRSSASTCAPNKCRHASPTVGIAIKKNESKPVIFCSVAKVTRFLSKDDVIHREGQHPTIYSVHVTGHS